MARYEWFFDDGKRLASQGSSGCGPGRMSGWWENVEKRKYRPTRWRLPGEEKIGRTSGRKGSRWDIAGVPATKQTSTESSMRRSGTQDHRRIEGNLQKLQATQGSTRPEYKCCGGGGGRGGSSDSAGFWEFPTIETLSPHLAMPAYSRYNNCVLYSLSEPVVQLELSCAPFETVAD